MTSKTYSMNSLKPQKIINQSLIGLKGLGQDINLKPICGGSPGSALPMPKYGQVCAVTKSAI